MAPSTSGEDGVRDRIGVGQAYVESLDADDLRAAQESLERVSAIATAAISDSLQASVERITETFARVVVPRVAIDLQALSPLYQRLDEIAETARQAMIGFDAAQMSVLANLSTAAEAVLAAQSEQLFGTTNALASMQSALANLDLTPVLAHIATHPGAPFPSDLGGLGDGLSLDILPDYEAIAAQAFVYLYVMSLFAYGVLRTPQEVMDILTVMYGFTAHQVAVRASIYLRGKFEGLRAADRETNG